MPYFDSAQYDISEKFLKQNSFSALLIFILFVLPLASFSLPSDSTKAFPLNDPRNPHCPCHKYQKLADEEYKKLMKEQNKLPINNQVDDKKDNGLLASSNTSNSKNYSTHKFKKKKNMKRKTKFRRIFCVSDWSVFKRWKDPSACFKWK